MSRWENDIRVTLEKGVVSGTFRSLAYFLVFHANNISENGMMIVVDKKVEIGRTFAFQMALGTKQEAFEGVAVVRWTEQEEGDSGSFRVGCEFLQLARESKKLVKTLVRNHANHGDMRDTYYARVA